VKSNENYFSFLSKPLQLGEIIRIFLPAACFITDIVFVFKLHFAETQGKNTLRNRRKYLIIMQFDGF